MQNLEVVCSYILQIKMNIPLSCYIHIPWCVKKCPYCDFNSHGIKNNSFPEQHYLECLIQEIQYWSQQEKRPIQSIFIGGGTPSLFSDKSIAYLLENLSQNSHISNDAEITMEVNPGTVERKFIAGYRSAGVNRISLGVQSFNDNHLKILGRIHNKDEVLQAVEHVSTYFENYNLDIMYGLPGQTIHELSKDLEYAVKCAPKHLSFYNLTIEPNTLFEKYTPKNLPSIDQCYDMQDLIIEHLKSNHYTRYEVSAYAQTGYESQHNSNYWLFGDYIGIGAGASSKISNKGQNNAVKSITRVMNIKHPESYMKADFLTGTQKLTLDIISDIDIVGEFMMNALRQTQGFDISLFEQRTGLHYSIIQEKIEKYKTLGMLEQYENKIAPTEWGLDMINEILLEFL